MTQEWSLQHQLEAGIRFLDLRVKSDGWLYHGPMACALTLEAAIQACAAFLEAHRSEFVLVRVKDEERSGTSGLRVHELVLGLAARLPLRLRPELDTVGDLRAQAQ